MMDQVPRVVVTGTLPPGFMNSVMAQRVDIQQARTDDELRAAVREANVLYGWQIPNIVPSETPELRWIQLPSAGADHVRHLPVWKSDIIISASQGIHTVPMSEHAFALLLALLRHVPDLVRSQDQKEWHRHGLRFPELRGKTMGIIGWGKVGDGIAHLARAFGMRIIGTRWSVLVPREVPSRGTFVYEDSPWLEPLDMPPDIVYPTAHLHDVLAQSDVVMLILPLTDETRGSISTAEFRSLKHGAFLVNIGRGAVIEERALIQAMTAGKLAGAALDVFENEPLPRSSPLWTMPNVIISPHVGGVSDRTRERAAWFFAVNLNRYLEGQQLLNVVKRDQGY